ADVRQRREAAEKRFGQRRDAIALVDFGLTGIVALVGRIHPAERTQFAFKTIQDKERAGCVQPVPWLDSRSLAANPLTGDDAAAEIGQGIGPEAVECGLRFVEAPPHYARPASRIDIVH